MQPTLFAAPNVSNTCAVRGFKNGTDTVLEIVSVKNGAVEFIDAYAENAPIQTATEADFYTFFTPFPW